MKLVNNHNVEVGRIQVHEPGFRKRLNRRKYMLKYPRPLAGNPQLAKVSVT